MLDTIIKNIIDGYPWIIGLIAVIVLYVAAILYYAGDEKDRDDSDNWPRLPPG